MMMLPPSSSCPTFTVLLHLLYRSPDPVTCSASVQPLTLHKAALQWIQDSAGAESLSDQFPISQFSSGTDPVPLTVSASWPESISVSASRESMRKGQSSCPGSDTSLGQSVTGSGTTLANDSVLWACLSTVRQGPVSLPCLLPWKRVHISPAPYSNTVTSAGEGLIYSFLSNGSGARMGADAERSSGRRCVSNLTTTRQWE
ncbi:glycine receptor subunit alphaZ1 [Lates japonicus]|uniref:Glycine receptor subunit alphaZ1 n=1 Tax=Lates japonicus TaxID=270547 RepID=A0AAD3NC14_LATJO|nr:glycine receptor subunit alphaZ1 [Lates japonicus]